MFTALLRHQFRRFIAYRGTAVFLAFGWVLTTLLVFIQGQFISQPQASLEPLFTYAPWVLALMVPALTMGIAEAPRRGLTERLLALPLTPFQCTLGPWVFQALLLGIWVLGFWPLIGTLYYLGQPDVGPLAAGLTALFLLAVVLAGLNTAIATRTSTAVGAFLLSLSTNLIILLPGLSFITEWATTMVPPPLVNGIIRGLPLHAFNTCAAGQITVQATATLLAWLLLGIFLSFLVSAKANAPWLKPTFILGAFTITCILLAALPFTAPWQLDVTADHLFTLSPASKAIAENVKTPTTLTLYVSRRNPDAPSALAETTHTLEALLNRIHNTNPSFIHTKTVDTDRSPANAYAALANGIDEQPLPQGTGYFFGLSAKTPTHSGTLSKLDPNRAAFLELDILSLLAETTRDTPPHILVFTTDANASLTTELAPLLAPFGTVETTTTAPLGISPTTALVVLADDPVMPSATLAALQNYMAEGGRLLLLPHTAPRPEVSSTQTDASGTQILPDFAPFSTVLPTYGINLNPAVWVADPSLAALASKMPGGTGATPFWLALGATNTNPRVPFTTDIQRLLIPNAIGLETTSSTLPLTLTTVLTTSANATLISQTAVAGTPPHLTPDANPSPATSRFVATLATGSFSAGSSKQGALMVFASSRWLTPPFTHTAQNATFFQNSIAFLLGDTALDAVRTKGTTQRPLKRVTALVEGISRRNAAAEQLLETRLDALADTAAAQPPQSQAYVKAVQESFDVRQQLRQLRGQAVTQVRLLEDALLLINLLAMPLLLALTLMLLRHR